MCLSVWGRPCLRGWWSKALLLSLQPPPMAQPPPLPQVLAPQPMGTIQPVTPHLPPYLAPTSQVVAPAQMKPLQMPQPPLQPLAQVPPQVLPGWLSSVAYGLPFLGRVPGHLQGLFACKGGAWAQKCGL